MFNYNSKISVATPKVSFTEGVEKKARLKAKGAISEGIIKARGPIVLVGRIDELCSRSTA